MIDRIHDTVVAVLRFPGRLFQALVDDAVDYYIDHVVERSDLDNRSAR